MLFNTFHLNGLSLILVRYYTMITSYPRCKFDPVACLAGSLAMVSADVAAAAADASISYFRSCFFPSNISFAFIPSIFFTLIIGSEMEVAKTLNAR